MSFSIGSQPYWPASLLAAAHDHCRMDGWMDLAFLFYENPRCSHLQGTVLVFNNTCTNNGSLN